MSHIKLFVVLPSSTHTKKKPLTRRKALKESNEYRAEQRVLASPQQPRGVCQTEAQKPFFMCYSALFLNSEIKKVEGFIN